ncbi:MAG: DNA-binding protein Alba [Nanoarchaeota archaeon]|nr:DNA-binding protein Alba [Nanoarchaeota archaeon]
MTKKDDNFVLIGKKAPMSYVFAVITQFQRGAENVVIKARGKSISRAVDVAEITKNKFLNDLKVGQISVGTERMSNEEGDESNVSTIEIPLTK